MKQGFVGVLLKPLDQQGDRDKPLIDPDGVKFDPLEEYPIWRDFNYNVPDDMLGSGKISRLPDGTIVVSGYLKEGLIPEDRETPWKLAIGVIADKIEPGETLRTCGLMSIAFTTRHSDPTQPTIVIGTTRRDKAMNLVRLGHYFNPGNDSCQTALVVKVVKQGAIDSVVNLVVWDSDGDQTKHLDVQEYTNPQPSDESASFHLSASCPWQR